VEDAHLSWPLLIRDKQISRIFSAAFLQVLPLSATEHVPLEAGKKKRHFFFSNQVKKKKLPILIPNFR
jgi:hypothetical protein